MSHTLYKKINAFWRLLPFKHNASVGVVYKRFCFGDTGTENIMMQVVIVIWLFSLNKYLSCARTVCSCIKNYLTEKPKLIDTCFLHE